ncbi:hypothetical protein Dimus_017532 [Dionaea muscipula]
MSPRNITSGHPQLQARVLRDPISRFFFVFAISVLFLLPCAKSVSFNFTKFDSNTQNITYGGDAFASSGVIQLTKNQADGSLADSVGRASYSNAIQLWDPTTGNLTDFTTRFSFIIKQVNASFYGDGLAFFLAPFDDSTSNPPDNSAGGSLGLYNSTDNSTIGIEFDSFQNTWDPSSDHVGIDVKSIVSVTDVNWPSSIKTGSTANAWVTYDATTKNLSVFLTYADNPTFDGNSSLSHIIDLTTVLPPKVRVGFSAATGSGVEIHNILSWSFSSSLEDASQPGKLHKKIWLIAVGILASLLLSMCGLLWFILRRRRRRSIKRTDDLELDVDVDVEDDDDFENGTGPKRFSYRELSRATDNFSEEGKLGEGGFGGVYRGLLTNPNPNIEVAVKRVSRSSKQGRKEYVSEVKIISRLRHRNLVQLIGWCHEQRELLLVYEFMPNGSLDFHLFGKQDPLPWTIRHKIALGLASALLYLHEEWEQCVVHRDIKSSNVMLDSGFNAKLGDFGLARLVDHGLGSQTTVLAGTMGYLAPECVITGKASKESDVYSFGVVALEIACGRRPVEPREEPSKVRLVEWVWGLYGKGLLGEAIDPTLDGQYDENQIQTLMVVGLWCCHPDYTIRPSIKQAINVLNLEAPVPRLPEKLPVPIYAAPPMDMSMFSYTTSSSASNTASSAGHPTSSSSQSASSSTAPLLRITAA